MVCNGDKEMTKYIIPQELTELLVKADAYDNLIKIYANLPFTFKKCMKLAIDARRNRQLFWKNLYELYPELSSKIELIISQNSEGWFVEKRHKE